MDHPQSIDGYAVLEFLGHGGMGWVYRVSEPTTGREVALKLLRTAVATTLLDRLRFEREFEVARALEHPALVGVFDKGLVDSQPYYTMELVAGANIRENLLRDRERPTREIWLQRVGALVAHLLDGLAYIHQHGIIHRDLKPENILITRDGIAKLCDLGLAKLEDHAGPTGETVHRMGTPDYISPEQARGEPNVDIRSDLYSLGATLYHMLLGSPPFTGGTAAAVMAKHLTEQVKAPRQLDPTLSPLGELIVLRLLQKRREDRYQTPAELLQKLDEAIRGLQAARGFVTGGVAAAPAPAPAAAPRAAPVVRRRPR